MSASTSARSPLATRLSPVIGLPVVVLLAVMWISEIADTVLPIDLDRFGIQPRSLEGLIGVPLAPLLHGGMGHLIANSLAFLVLGLTVAYTTGRFWAVTALVTLVGGLGVWLVAPPNNVTVGASGVLYGYAAFLVAWAVLTRRLLAFVVALAVIAVYGGWVWGVLPSDPRVSWQGHLLGAVAGVLTAWWLARGRRRAGR